ncbi:hypothetical protein [Undibacterium flavidum]|uniref:Uncharacterized protein n=1 Tax=Undibacterium flavidum TaxID=2762297 RepID=A0ABR6Y9W8_9BURK|nr:hypothetical protein [Undibacterium flavidum]MBC3873418.1 hypothetical protein [Undibacterium flavidum]
MKRHIPSEEDWGNYQDDLDQNYAHGIFAGRDSTQVMSAFARSSIDRAEDLRFMPTVPFQYYIFSFCEFVTSAEVLTLNDGLDASDAASCFLNLVIYKLEHQRSDIEPIINELMPFVERVALNQSLYDADIDIYGDFKENFFLIQELVGKQIASR